MVGKARFSAWASPTKAEFRDPELFVLPQICWMSPRTTVPKQGVSDGNAQIGNGCKEPAVGKHWDVLGPTSHQGKTNLSEASLAGMQQGFVVPQSQLEWFGSQWQSCPDNLLLCSAGQDSPHWPPRHSWGWALLFHGAQPHALLWAVLLPAGHCATGASSSPPGTEQHRLLSMFHPSSFNFFFN